MWYCCTTSKTNHDPGRNIFCFIFKPSIYNSNILLFITLFLIITNGRWFSFFLANWIHFFIFDLAFRTGQISNRGPLCPNRSRLGYTGWWVIINSFRFLNCFNSSWRAAWKSRSRLWIAVGWRVLGRSKRMRPIVRTQIIQQCEWWKHFEQNKDDDGHWIACHCCVQEHNRSTNEQRCARHGNECDLIVLVRWEWCLFVVVHVRNGERTRLRRLSLLPDVLTIFAFLKIWNEQLASSACVVKNWTIHSVNVRWWIECLGSWTPSSRQNTLLQWRSGTTRWCKSVSSWHSRQIQSCNQSHFEARTDSTIPTARTLRTWPHWPRYTLFWHVERVLLPFLLTGLIVWSALHSCSIINVWERSERSE